MVSQNHKIKTNGSLITLFIFIVFFNIIFTVGYDAVKGIGRRFNFGDGWWHSSLIFIVMIVILGLVLYFTNDFDIGSSEDIPF